MKPFVQVCRYTVALLFIFLISSCATYYHREEKFNNYFANGDFEKAKSYLNKKKKAATGKNKLLYNLNMGTLCWLEGKSEESNTYFNTADLIGEDYRTKLSDVAVSYLTNPMNATYKGEDFEMVLLHYYKALNYLDLGNYESAIVECKRINIQLNKLNDKYKSKNRYEVDAFAYLLTGLIYDAAKEYNDAFVAYRNAVEAYENYYSKLFGIDVPLQLKKDLIRAAYYTGFQDQVEFYQKKFNLYDDLKTIKNNGELVFFWNNGLGPVKSENSINFTLVRGQGGYVTFVNKDYGLNIPVFLPQNDTARHSALSQLELIRVAFPSYQERRLLFNKAQLIAEGKSFNLETVENINDIAFKSLKDRMLREIGEAVTRVALKKTEEYLLKKKNKDLGAVVGIVNAVTEKADTRNWQTLPYAIHYTRLSLPEGEHDIQFKASSSKTKDEENRTFHFMIRSGRTLFHSYQSLNPANLYESGNHPVH